MDIDTGDSPPVSSRPYTLPLKHYEWVQREIESLEWAGVITKSMSKWTTPIVNVPKKLLGNPQREDYVLISGKYEFLMVPFGLAQAPAYFQLLTILLS